MIVVDASVVAKCIFPEEHSDLALKLIAAQTRRLERAVAPPLLAFEVTNIVRQRVRRAMMPPDAAAAALDKLFALPIALLPSSDQDRQWLHHRALSLAQQYTLDATYDAHYVALAEHFECPLWTADARLARKLVRELPYLHTIESYIPDS